MASTRCHLHRTAATTKALKDKLLFFFIAIIHCVQIYMEVKVNDRKVQKFPV